MGYGRSNVKANEYAEMDRLALEVLQDYNCFSFPIDVFKIAKNNLNAEIIPYSALSDEQKSQLFERLSRRDYSDVKKGFTVFEVMSDETIKHIIYYNDSLGQNDCRYTIAHEIKHILLGEDNPSQKQEDLAEYFAKVFIAPKSVAIVEGIIDSFDIEEYFELPAGSASFLNKGLINRLSAKGMDFFESFEKEYLERRNDFLGGDNN